LVRILIALSTAFVLSSCDRLLPQSYDQAAPECSEHAQTTFANSPLTGWSRERAIGLLAAACMEKKGFAWFNNDRQTCKFEAPNSTEAYPRLDKGCWKRQG
jgi:hypothetical protein